MVSGSVPISVCPQGGATGRVVGLLKDVGLFLLRVKKCVVSILADPQFGR